MSERVQQIPVGEITRSQTLEAVVVRACVDCGAPGTYKSHESILNGWPGCYVEPGDGLEGQLVGDICPNCGANRSQQQQDEPLGVIWRREWRSRLSSTNANKGFFKKRMALLLNSRRRRNR